MSKEERVLDYVQRLRVRSADIRESWTELLRRSHSDETQFHRQRGRYHLEVLKHLGVEWVVWIPQDCYPSNSGNSFLEQLQSFGGEVGRHHRESGDVSARMREARDQTGPDRIDDERHDDGDSGCGTLGRLGRNRAVHNDHIHFTLHQVGDQLRYSIVVTV